MYLKYEHRNSLRNNDLTLFKDLPTEIQNIIIENNKIDISLYEYAKTHLSKKITENQEKFQSDLELFKRSNKNFKASILNRNVAKIFKGIRRYFIEPLFLSKNQ